MPTRKWWAALVTGLGTIATMYVVTNAWDDEETLALIGLAVERFVSWLVPNKPGKSGLAEDEGQPALVEEAGLSLVEAIVALLVAGLVLFVVFKHGL